LRRRHLLIYGSAESDSTPWDQADRLVHCAGRAGIGQIEGPCKRKIWITAVSCRLVTTVLFAALFPHCDDRAGTQVLVSEAGEWTLVAQTVMWWGRSRLIGQSFPHRDGYSTHVVERERPMIAATRWIRTLDHRSSHYCAGAGGDAARLASGESGGLPSRFDVTNHIRVRTILISRSKQRNFRGRAVRKERALIEDVVREAVRQAPRRPGSSAFLGELRV